MKGYKYFSLLSGLFIASLLISNVLSSAKIVDLKFIVLDAGTLLFPLCYILGDILTEVYGFYQAKKVIWTGFLCSTLMMIFVYLTGLLPPEAGWSHAVGETAYDLILGSIANGGIVVASLSAYLVGEFSNAIILSKLKVKTKGKFLWLRTMSSTVIGQLLDSLIFITVACSFGVFPWKIAISLLVSIFVFKVLIEFLFTPVLYLITDVLKKREGVDHYDTQVSYSPF